MEEFLEFISLSDPNVRYVVLGSILLTASSSIVGVFSFLKKKTLVGDAVAHSVLPGVCLAFILSGSKNPLYLVPGAFITGWISMVFIDKIVAHTKLKEDTAIGLVLSVFFGFGIVALTYIQHAGYSNQSGLDHFLFGKAASIVSEDLKVFSIIAIVLIAAVLVFFKEFFIISFDENFASAIGMPVRRIELILTTLTVLAVVVGIQAVGVVLMAAMLITPSAAARFWTDNLRVMILLAAIFGAVSGLTGAYASYLAPTMPTGPWIVVIISGIALISFSFAPRRGILYRLRRQWIIKKKIQDENVLKTIYQLGEKDGKFFSGFTPEEIIERRIMHLNELKTSLNRLKHDGFLEKEKGSWKFTSAGKEKGRRVVKLHRLWEVYLTQYLNIAPDHVHDDAETIEHIITPELEKRLEQLLEYPAVDPHESRIPYR